MAQAPGEGSGHLNYIKTIQQFYFWIFKVQKFVFLNDEGKHMGTVLKYEKTADHFVIANQCNKKMRIELDGHQNYQSPLQLLASSPYHGRVETGQWTISLMIELPVNGRNQVIRMIGIIRKCIQRTILI